MASRVAWAIVVTGLTGLAVMLINRDFANLAAIPIGFAIGVVYMLVQSRRTSYISGEEVLRCQNRIPVIGQVLRFGDTVNRRLYGFDRPPAGEPGVDPEPCPVTRGSRLASSTA